MLVLVWVPLAVLIPLAASQTSDDPSAGFLLGVQSAIIGGLLLAAVWRFSERFPWPARPGFGFYLAHVGIGVGFAVLWRASVFVADALPDVGGAGASVRTAFAGPFVVWDLMLKLVVYGFVVGVSYAVREGVRARAAQLRAARLETLATRAQLSALQSQLNPHFLFNALHSLSVLIRRDPELAEEALDRLGELLRYSLDHGARDTVPLREEVAFVENYVAIEKIRLGERFRLVRDVDDRALGYWVPPFCLQPLVENAIRHGLAPRPAGGTVWITIRLRDDGLSLAVRDDGARAADPAERPVTGRGLDSLRQRVEAWEEGPGSLELAASPGGGFCATVRIPVDAARAVRSPDRAAVAATEPS